jgi:hypothetical protein
MRAKVSPSTPGAPPLARQQAYAWAKMSSRRTLSCRQWNRRVGSCLAFMYSTRWSRRIFSGVTRLTPISPPRLVPAHPEPGPLSSPGITRVHRSYEPLRRLPSSVSHGAGARSPWQPDRPPVLRISACVRAAPTTPASRTPLTCRCIEWSSAAFVYGDETRRSHQRFRGLLRLHSRCGPHACWPAQSGPVSPGLRWIGHPPHLPGSYQGVPTPPWTGLSPAALTHLFTAHPPSPL